MRFVVAKRHGRRGGGLGNEMFPWAKGWIASQVLDARLIGPSWGLNQRKYHRNFGTSRLDFLAEEALAHLPHHAFTESEYRATGEIDFGAAIRKWATTRGLKAKSSYIVSVEGMWGGYPVDPQRARISAFEATEQPRWAAECLSSCIDARPPQNFRCRSHALRQGWIQFHTIRRRRSRKVQYLHSWRMVFVGMRGAEETIWRSNSVLVFHGSPRPRIR